MVKALQISSSAYIREPSTGRSQLSRGSISNTYLQNSLPEQCHRLLGPSVLNLRTFLDEGPAGHQPVCQLGLHTATPRLQQMAGSTACVVAASPFPVSGRSDGLSHVGSDSRWMLQGQGWLNRNHGGAGLLSRLLRSFFFQHLCRRGSPRPKSREGDGLCLFTAHREHKKALEGLVVEPTSSSSPCLARADLVFAFHRGVPFCLAENSFFNKLQH